MALTYLVLVYVVSYCEFLLVGALGFGNKEFPCFDEGYMEILHFYLIGTTIYKRES